MVIEPMMPILNNHHFKQNAISENGNIGDWLFQSTSKPALQKNTVISPNSVVWKLCFSTKFPHPGIS